MNEILKAFNPSVFPCAASENIQNLFYELEKSFKQPIKQVFPYPIDIIKYVNPETKKLHKLVFEVALAGKSKDEIKVQLKKGKYLSISVDAFDKKKDSEGMEEIYISNSISYRRGEISFRLFNDIDMDRFKPIFKDGLLKIEIYVKEQINDEDILDIEIN